MISRRYDPTTCGDETEHLFDVILEAGFSGSIPVGGDEMRPLLERDDRVIATPFLGLPCPGQIVLARHQGRAVVRRLTGVRMRNGRRRYCLQADCGPAGRIEVLREDLIGRPTAVVRGGVLSPLEDAPSRRGRTARRKQVPRRRVR